MPASRDPRGPRTGEAGSDDPGSDEQGDPQAPSQETWQYHLPEFLDGLAQEGTIDLREQAPGPFEGFLYHHRGARVPAQAARLSWEDEAFRLTLEALDGSTWTAAFRADADWDVYLLKLPNDEPALAWMSDAEFHEEEADEHEAKAHAVARGRFSFGLYFESARTWGNLRDGLGDKEEALLFLRPSGRTYVPPDGFDLDRDFVPEELRPGEGAAPGHLGLAGLVRDGGEGGG